MPKRIPATASLILLLCALAAPLVRGDSTQTVGPIYAGPQLDYQPAIIRMQPGGQLLVIFERIDPVSFLGDFFVTLSSDNGETWTPPQPALTSPLNERHPALIQLAPDSFLLFYLMDETGGGSYRIHRATSSDGWAWTDQGMIDLGWTAPGEINPCVIREADGTLTMTYHRLSGPSYIAQSSDNGATWDRLQTQISPGNAQLPRLARRESDGLYLVTYQVGGSDLDMYAKTTTNPYDWSGPQIPFSTLHNSHDSQPIVLEDGTFLVVYAMTPVYYFDLFYKTSSDGVNWSDEVQVTNDPLHYDTQPHPLLQGTLGRVLLTWSHQVSAEPYVDHDVYINTGLAIPPDLTGSSKSVDPAAVTPAGLLSYTLYLTNEGYGPTVARLTDPLPAKTIYDGGLWASSGDYGYDPGNALITWTGTLSTSGRVTVTFRLSTTLDLGDGEVVTNAAWLTDDEGVTLTLVATATGDTQPPVSILVDPHDGQVISSSAYLVQGAATDTVGLAAVAVSVDGGPWQPAVGWESWSFDWQGIADGGHSLRSRATDLAGHVEAPTRGITVTVDATPPALLAHTPAAGALEVPLSATVVLTFSEAILSSTLTCIVTPDPGGWSLSWNAAATAAYLDHDDFAGGQTYTFTVLQARDQAGNPLAPSSWSFTTVAQPCAAADILSLTTAISDCRVAFGAVVTGTEPLAYLWDFGFQVSTATNPLVDFGASGTYPYTLTVANCDGAQDVATDTVTVDCVPPCRPPSGVSLTYVPSSPLVWQTVHFTGSVTSGTLPLTFSWSFGDGGSAEGPSTSHAFTAAGVFTTSLAVANRCGSAAEQRAVRVAPYRIYLPLVCK